MNRIVVLDFETYPHAGNSFLMEIGCVEIVDGKIGHSFHTMVRPIHKVNDFVLKLTGITESELVDAPLFTDILDEFHGFIKNSVIVAHNAILDRMGYHFSCQHYSIEPKLFQWIDSQDLVKILYPEADKLQLQVLLSHFGLTDGVSHRALDDARGLANILLHLKANYRLEMTQFEVSLLKKSKQDSIVKLMRFLLRFFCVALPDSDTFDLHTTELSPDHPTQDIQQPTIHHITFSKDQLIQHATMLNGTTILVTNGSINDDLPYIDDYSMYYYPPKFSHFYLTFIKTQASHAEVVEVIGLINWLRQTSSYRLADLNENLKVRANQLMSDYFDPNPNEKFRFFSAMLSQKAQHHSVIQCHTKTFALIAQYSTRLLREYHVVFHNFIQLNVFYNRVFSDQFSLRSLRPLRQVVLSFSSLMNDLLDNDQCDLNFIQDVARIRYFIDLINEENQSLFSQLDHLTHALSVNIYDNKRQVLINTNVRETLEWQDVSASIKLISYYFDELIRIFERVSFYIFSYYSEWISDLIIQFKYQKKLLLNYLSSDQSKVFYIESSVKHAPSTCSLTMASIYEHSFYRCVFEKCRSLTVHQPINNRFSLRYLDRLLGMPLHQQLELTGCESNHVEFTTFSFSQIKTLIEQNISQKNVYLFVPNQFRLRVWRKKLYSMIKKHKSKNITPVKILTYDKLRMVTSKNSPIIIFPEFQVSNILQPIHQQRLAVFKGSEKDYNDQLLSENIHYYLSNFFHLSDFRIIFNVYEPI